MTQHATQSTPGSARRRPPDRCAALDAFARACNPAGPVRIGVTDEGDHPAGEHPLHGPFAFIGRGRSSDVRLDSPGVSPRHAFVLAVGDRAFVLDLGSRTGTHTADGPGPAAWVESGEEVRVGPFALRLELPAGGAADGATGGPALAALELVNRPGPAALQPLDGAVTLVGRASACALRGYGPTLARYHCALVRAGGQLWVVDLRGGAGTRVNGRPVRFARLRDGDLLEAGEWAAVPRPATGAPEAVAPANPGPPPALAPFGQMMDQFQQCVLMMGQMFRAMQQEHLGLVHDQVVQLRDVARALLDRQADLPYAEMIADAIPDALPAPGPAPTPAADPDALLRAHAWFNHRLAHLSGAGR